MKFATIAVIALAIISVEAVDKTTETAKKDVKKDEKKVEKKDEKKDEKKVEKKDEKKDSKTPAAKPTSCGKVTYTTFSDAKCTKVSVKASTLDLTHSKVIDVCVAAAKAKTTCDTTG